MNYRDDPAVLRLGSRWRFDPNAFDLTAARARVAAALASPASVPSGPKKAVLFGDPNDAGGGADSVPKGARRTVDFNAFLKDGLRNGAAFQTEVVRDKRDRRAGALCACCGKPITEPRMCAACRKVYYCDRGWVVSSFCILTLISCFLPVARRHIGRRSINAYARDAALPPTK